MARLRLSLLLVLSLVLWCAVAGAAADDAADIVGSANGSTTTPTQNANQTAPAASGPKGNGTGEVGTLCKTGNNDCLSSLACTNGVCTKPPPPLFPMTWEAGVATLTCGIVAAVSVVGGIGGGGLYLPLLMAIMKISPGFSIPLSKTMIFGANLVILVYYFGRRSTIDQPVIDMKAVAMLAPLSLSGTVLGVYLNLLLPSWIIFSLLIIILGLITLRTLFSGLVALKKERAEMTQGKMEILEDEDVVVGIGNGRTRTSTSSPHVPSQDPWEGKPPSNSLEMSHLDDPMTEEPKSSLDGNMNEISGSDTALPQKSAKAKPPLRRKWSIRNNFTMPTKQELYFLYLPPICLWLILVAFTALRAPTQNCSSLYWGLTLTPVFLSIPVTAFSAYFVFSTPSSLKDHFKWSAKNLFLNPLAAFLAGCISTALGVGGGVLVGPLLLEMAIVSDSSVVTGVSAGIVFFTSSTAMVHFIALNRLEVTYALWFSMIALLSATVGVWLIMRRLERNKRMSLVVLSVAGVMALSVILAAVQGSKDLSSVGAQSLSELFSIDTGAVCSSAGTH